MIEHAPGKWAPLLNRSANAKCRSILTATLVLAHPLNSLAGEDVPIDKLPEAVIKAVNDRFPNAKIRSAEREVEDGKTVYEVKMRHDNKRYELDITPDGKIIDVDDETDD